MKIIAISIFFSLPFNHHFNPLRTQFPEEPKDIYENSDAYKDLAVQVFNEEGMRKKAKIMFLSYTYGMSLDNIISSVIEMGGNQKRARDYFSEFAVFEDWKKYIHKAFMDNGRIATISGNHLNRASESELSEKEKRTSVNHVIQGTATYIFKRALWELSKLDGAQILIPMHDAVLFQHSERINPKIAVEIFESVMTDELGDKVVGKASIENFY